MKWQCAIGPIIYQLVSVNAVLNFERPTGSAVFETFHRERRGTDDDTKLAVNDAKPVSGTDEIDSDDTNQCITNLAGLKQKVNSTTTVYSLKDNNPSVAIAWHGKGTGTLLAVTTKEYVAWDLLGTHVKNQKSASRVYYSLDYGATFTEVTDIKSKFSLKENEELYIKKSHGVITNNINTKRVILIKQPEHINVFGAADYGADQGSTIWINDDVSSWAKAPNAVGHQWKRVTLDFTLDGNYLEQHPKDELMMLTVGVSKNDDRSLYITTDGGYHWNFVAKNVHRYRWDPQIKKGPDAKHDGFYYTTDPTQTFQASKFHYELHRGEQWSSTDKGQRLLLAVNVYSFGVQDQFLYVSVRYQPTEGRSDPERIMLVSTSHGANLQAVQLPNIGKDRFYAILDASESMIFLHVDDDGDTGYGTIYTSDQGGKVFDRSLRFHLYPNTGDLTDFYKVSAFGSEGTYITSKLMVDDKNSVQTVITFDKGVGWWPIDKTMIEDYDVLKKDRCTDSTCNLQIHNRFSLSKKVHVPSTPLSSKSAPGLILAHGNLGDALATKNVDVYLSEDGGYNWRRALKGTHHLQIMDQGGIVVAIPSPEIGGHMVDTVKISYDMGKCWIDHKFTGENGAPIEYTGLIVEPDEKQAKMSIWGWGNITADNPTGHWMIYHIDLSEKVVPKCKDDDFMTYLHHCNGKAVGGYSATNGQCCHLGQKVEFEMIKADSYCVIGSDKRWDDKQKFDGCICKMEDFQCGFGHVRGSDGFTCIDAPTKGTGKTDVDHDICWMAVDANAAVDFINQIPAPKYRKIPGDKCTGGFEDQVKQMGSTLKTLNCQKSDANLQNTNEGLKFNKDTQEVEQIDARCRFVDADGNCKKESFYSDKIRQEFAKVLFPNAPITSSQQGGGHTGWIMVGLMCMSMLCFLTYYFYYKGNKLPGALSRYSRYQFINNTGYVETNEDEAPLDLTNDGYTAIDDDDILA